MGRMTDTVGGKAKLRAVVQPDWWAARDEDQLLRPRVLWQFAGTGKRES